MQSLVNQKNLEQLSSIGKRLNELEKSKCKKTADKSKIKSKRDKSVNQNVAKSTHMHTSDTVGSKTVDTSQTVSSTQTNTQTLPSLSSIRKNAINQQQVDQKIHELSQIAKTGTDSKNKSHRGWPVEVYIKIESNGHMSRFWQVLIKSMFLMIS